MVKIIITDLFPDVKMLRIQAYLGGVEAAGLDMPGDELVCGGVGGRLGTLEDVARIGGDDDDGLGEAEIVGDGSGELDVGDVFVAPSSEDGMDAAEVLGVVGVVLSC
jgi:hypothetical protein